MIASSGSVGSVLTVSPDGLLIAIPETRYAHSVQCSHATTMLTTLRLKCLIEGEDIVFPVTAGCDDEVSDLKELIRSERALDSLKDIDPHTLELWKPKDSNPIAAERNNLVERIVLLGDISTFADELDPSETVFSIFPTQPPRGYIHIIVKVPHINLFPPHVLLISSLSRLRILRATLISSHIPWLSFIGY
ncbi:hypothetical protein M378DRAFT_554864 [Amanita muscaria Koide BX008]|uniref:Crinkler effector protein N-terminal domain-containing protein n=1 Tax=Amanita muscaria (strain Koide BX008) TaxID=946122 RepID=A0A0C2X8C7_AMAMK|nr:hypothetical protein M378DRAFT_554864 [Amanita muscaria Koide BX008]